ncbi:MAG: hypothetical protein JSW17_03190 [Candidatus Omnitrophota bacterium]|nr:MAG: hypothetical protein JSW17_03190 [Candidatus Omnitrophota bacterium]
MRKRSFSLIEIILVIVVIGISFVGLAVAIHNALIGIHKPEALSGATALAVKEAERLIATDFDYVTSENFGNPKSYFGDFSNYSWEVRVGSIDDVQPNLGSDPTMDIYKIVEVRVYHNAIDYVAIKFLINDL